ncbi:MarR family winged helix-turn-helix transcriptional regulator [Desulfovibrio cuneatus]|uniref:MarR family winged helix-turn-helix transcriptional regulator n=1 Tax=Desulfovibrio cuneatus TaxID=159728 RepID=UPI00040AF6E9|nr:MarR family winged helix-turn-helix transcriptional regulator [Desulfovibrio cuneatus]
MQKTTLDIIYTIEKITNYQWLYNLSKRQYNTEERYYESELHVLSHIVRDNTITLKDTASLLYKTKSYISQIVSALETKELIVKSRSATDARKSIYRITDKGRAVYQAHIDYDSRQSEQLAQAMREFSPEEQVLFLRLLQCYHDFQLIDSSTNNKANSR